LKGYVKKPGDLVEKNFRGLVLGLVPFIRMKCGTRFVGTPNPKPNPPPNRDNEIDE
jgi:hypothetical protein